MAPEIVLRPELNVEEGEINPRIHTNGMNPYAMPDEMTTPNG